MSGLGHFLGGLTTGFASGYSLMQDAQDRKLRREQEQQRLEHERERIGMERDEMQRQRKLRSDLGDAMRPVQAQAGTIVGEQGNRALYADPAEAGRAAEDAQLNAELNGAPASPAATMARQGFGVGNQLADDQGVAGRMVVRHNSKLATQKRIANAYGSAGEHGKWDEAQKKIETYFKEGMDQALQLAIDGRHEDSINAFEGTGTMHMDGKPIIENYLKKDPITGQDVRTARISGVIGGKPFVIEDAASTREGFLHLNDQIKANIERGKIKVDLDKNAETSRHNRATEKNTADNNTSLAKDRDESRKIQQQQVNQQGWYQRAQIGLQSAQERRLAAAASEAKAANGGKAPEGMTLKDLATANKEISTLVSRFIKTDSLSAPEDRDKAMRQHLEVTTAAQDVFTYHAELAAAGKSRAITAEQAVRIVQDGKIQVRALQTPQGVQQVRTIAYGDTVIPLPSNPREFMAEPSAAPAAAPQAGPRRVSPAATMAAQGAAPANTQADPAAGQYQQAINALRVAMQTTGAKMASATPEQREALNADLMRFSAQMQATQKEAEQRGIAVR
jgi:hypothetical protein